MFHHEKYDISAQVRNRSIDMARAYPGGRFGWLLVLVSIVMGYPKNKWFIKLDIYNGLFEIPKIIMDFIIIAI